MNKILINYKTKEYNRREFYIKKIMKKLIYENSIIKITLDVNKSLFKQLITKKK